jgi:hypothetical protein
MVDDSLRVFADDVYAEFLTKLIRNGFKATSEGMHARISSDLSLYGSLLSPSGPSRSPLMNVLNRSMAMMSSQSSTGMTMMQRMLGPRTSEWAKSAL